MSRDVRATAFGWVISLALHVGLAAYILGATSAPDLGFEFELPDEVEFGLTEAMTVSQGAAPEASAEEPSDPDEGEGEGEGGPDAGPPRPDAGPARRDAGPPQLAEAEEPDEGTGEEGEGTGGEEGEGDGVAFLPAGSQIALRMDVTRIRESPIGDDVRGFLRVLPDWQNVLGESGIDPLEDLDRLLVASPNLDRSRMILAGRANGGPERIRAAAESLARSANEEIAWATREGVPVARWHDPSGTERVIAIVGPRHFVICRPVDLPRVLAVALARAAEEAETEGEAVHPADALLSMEEGEGLSLEVEGARNFTRSRRPVDVLPTRLRFSMRDSDGAIAMRGNLAYEDGDQAEAAEAYWNRIREGYARNIITQTLGLGSILNRTEMSAEEDHLDVSVDLSMEEMRRLLGLGRMLFNRRAAADPEPIPAPPLPRDVQEGTVRQPDDRRPPPSPY